MLNSYPTVVFCVEEVPQIRCLQCKGEMPHIRTTRLPGSRYETRAFLCSACQITETFYFDRDALAKARQRA